jgi:hypothetical protein
MLPRNKLHILRPNRCYLPKRRLYVFVVRRNVNSSIVWDIPYSPLKVSQGLFGLFIDPENGGRHISPKPHLTFSRPHGVMSQKELHEADSKLLPTCFVLVSSLAYSSALKMEATCTSETSVDFHRTTRCYISPYQPLWELKILWHVVCFL